MTTTTQQRPQADQETQAVEQATLSFIESRPELPLAEVLRLLRDRAFPVELASRGIMDLVTSGRLIMTLDRTLKKVASK